MDSGHVGPFPPGQHRQTSEDWNILLKQFQTFAVNTMCNAEWACHWLAELKEALKTQHAIDAHRLPHRPACRRGRAKWTQVQPSCTNRSKSHAEQGAVRKGGRPGRYERRLANDRPRGAGDGMRRADALTAADDGRETTTRRASRLNHYMCKSVLGSGIVKKSCASMGRPRRMLANARPQRHGKQEHQGLGMAETKLAPRCSEKDVHTWFDTG